MPGLRQLVFSSLLRTLTYPQESATNSSKTSTTDSIAQDASFAFWFPPAWTLVGVLFTICACLLAFYTTLRRRDPLTTRLDQILAVLRTIEEPGSLRVVQNDVARSGKALSAPGQSLPEILTELRKSNGDPHIQSWLRPASHSDYIDSLRYCHQRPVLSLSIFTRSWLYQYVHITLTYFKF